MDHKTVKGTRIHDPGPGFLGRSPQDGQVSTGRRRPRRLGFLNSSFSFGDSWLLSQMFAYQARMPRTKTRMPVLTIWTEMRDSKIQDVGNVDVLGSPGHDINSPRCLLEKTTTQMLSYSPLLSKISVKPTNKLYGIIWMTKSRTR